jgi:hypothetical protein
MEDLGLALPEQADPEVGKLEFGLDGKVFQHRVALLF